MHARTLVLPLLIALSSTAIHAQVIRIIQGNQALFGTSLDAADIDGDGKTEFLVGAPASPGVLGRVELFTHDLKRIHAISGPDGFGLAASFLGDTDRDGYRDFVVGALDQVFVISGKSVSLIGVFKGPKGFQYGTVVADAGDVDKDGYHDVLIGAPAFSTPLGEVGAAEVRSGRTGGVLRRFFGSTKGARMGRALASAGDVDADGHADILVGSPGARKVECFSGKTGKVIHTFSQPTHAHFGHTVKGGRDLDGDGTPDIVVGAPDLPGSAARPVVMMFSGKAGTRRFTIAGPAKSWFGYALSVDADTNADGQYDIVVGTPALNTFNGGFESYSGKDGKNLFSFASSVPGSYGSSVTAAKTFVAAGVPAFQKGYVQILPGVLKPPISQRFGTGCGSGTPPTITTIGSASYGGLFQVEIKTAQRPIAAVLVIGASNKSWRGAKLPLNLGFMGASGCNLYASWDVSIPYFELSSNRVRMRARAPLQRVEAFLQALVYDHKAPATISSTRALRIVTGL